MLTVCQCGGGVLEECGLAHRFQASYGTVLIGRRSAQTDAELIDRPGAGVGERTEEQLPASSLALAHWKLDHLFKLWLTTLLKASRERLMKRRKAKAVQVFISGEEFCNSSAMLSRIAARDGHHLQSPGNFGSPPVLARFTCLIPHIDAFRPAQEKISYYPLIKLWLPQVFMKL